MEYLKSVIYEYERLIEGEILYLIILLYSIICI